MVISTNFNLLLTKQDIGRIDWDGLDITLFSLISSFIFLSSPSPLEPATATNPEGYRVY